MPSILLFVVLFAALTLALSAATLATGFGRVWGPLPIALYSFGMLVWLLAVATPGTLEAWVWVGLAATGCIEIGAAIVLALTSEGGSWPSPAVCRASRIFGTVAAIPVTGITAFLTLVLILWLVAGGGLPFAF